MTRLRWVTAGIAALPAGLVAIRLAGWWPCDVACQGGGFYQRLAGVDVLWPALIGYALLALALVHDAWCRPRWSRFSVALTGLLAGASLFYLWIAWSLGLLCPFCLTVHALVLVVLFSVAPDAAGSALLALLVGGLGLNAAFHHQVHPDIADRPEAAPGTSQPLTDLATRADANRQRGAATAPLTVEYGYSLQCPHCAAAHDPLLAALAPAISAGHVRLVLRPVVRLADPGSRLLAAWSFAAAARGPDILDRFIAERLDTKANLGRDELLTLDPALPALAAIAADGAFEPLIDRDQARLKQLAYRGATPFVVVLRDTTVLGRFAGEIPLADLTTLVGH
jgi:Thioredoxin